MATMATRGRHLVRGEGEAVWLLGDLYVFKVDSEQSRGEFALWETLAPVGHAGPPPHRHLREDETFMVLEGELEVHVGDETHRAQAGSVVHVPRGAVHFFRNTSPEPARFLVMVTPGGFERFFKEVGEEALDRETAPLPAGPPDVERLMAIAARHHCEILPPNH